MRIVRHFGPIIVMACSVFQANAQEVVTLDCDHVYTAAPKVVYAIDVGVIFPYEKISQFVDPILTQDLLDSIRKISVQRCAGVSRATMLTITIKDNKRFESPVGTYSDNARDIYLGARYDLQSEKWVVINNRAAEIEIELKRKREAEEVKRQKQNQEAQDLRKREEQEAQDLRKRKEIAVTGCSSGPKLSGGPWFSSTYSVAASDEAGRVNFFCVETVEYISAAPNPFGGNGARARFKGYKKGDFQPVVEVRDFFY